MKEAGMEKVNEERLREKLSVADTAQSSFERTGFAEQAAMWGEDVSIYTELLALRKHAKAMAAQLDGMRIVGFDCESRTGPCWIAYTPISNGNDAASTIGQKDGELKSALDAYRAEYPKEPA